MAMLQSELAPFDNAVPQFPVATRPARSFRWLLSLLSLASGVMIGMVVLALGLLLFGGARPVAANSGDSLAAWDTSVTLTDAFLTAQARSGQASQVKNPQLHVQADGKIAMDGQVTLIARQVAMHATLQPTIVNGKLSMTMVSVQLGGLTLPDALIRQIEGSVGSAMQPPATTVQTTLVKFEATDGHLVLYSKIGK